jgi:hypothetical protein
MSKLIILEARSPSYVQGGMIHLEINHPELGWLPFAASPDDVEEHGRDLYARAISGEFGDVKQYLKPLGEAITERIALIESIYKAFNEAPIQYTDHIYQADADSVTLMAQVSSALPNNAGIGWYDISNVEVPLTNAQFAELRLAILMRGQPLFSRRQARKESIRNATTVAEVEAVVW